MKKTIVALIVILAAAAVIATILITRQSDNKTSSTTPNSTTQATTNSDSNRATEVPQASSEEQAAAVITYTSSGFSPGSITVKSGDRVTVKNESSSTLDFASDPHPVHTENRELNIGEIRPGSTMTFTVTTKGTYGIHNHENSTHTGTIVVE